MSLGINKVIIAGELYADPTLRSFPTGALIANFMLVTKEDVKDKTTGEIKEYNRYHKVSAFGRLAEFVKEEAFKKDEMLLVEGSLRTRSYKNKEGVTVYTTEIFPNSIECLETRHQEPLFSENNPMPYIEPFGDEEIPF